MEVPQKTKNRTTVCSSNLTYGYISEENENTNSKCTPIFIATLFTIAKIWKQPNEWIKIWNGILLIHKKE